MVDMSGKVSELIAGLKTGDYKSLARTITLVENELEGYEELLLSLQPVKQIPVIGITGPPGAGKSTLINSLLTLLSAKGKRIGIVAVDPSSPFNFGSLLGDRLRMSEHFVNNCVFIRSLATRGSLGGLSAKIIEVVDVMKCFDFDYLLVETVGVGQSEVEVVGLADVTVLVLVPEAGDEVQTLKAGIMEIADIFVVNKGDREGADRFMATILSLVHSRLDKGPAASSPVVKAVATEGKGTAELISEIDKAFTGKANSKKNYLLAEKAYRLIQNKRMKDVHKEELIGRMEAESGRPGFNLYEFVRTYS